MLQLDLTKTNPIIDTVVVRTALNVVMLQTDAMKGCLVDKEPMEEGIAENGSTTSLV